MRKLESNRKFALLEIEKISFAVQHLLIRPRIQLHHLETVALELVLKVRTRKISFKRIEINFKAKSLILI